MRVLLLFSGGLDSTVLAHIAIERGHQLVPLFVDYCQPAISEERAACLRWCASHGIALCQVQCSVLAVSEAMGIGSGVPGPRVIPFRNLTMIVCALQAAAFHGCSEVWLGATASDAERYPDCRRLWIEHVSAAARSEGIAVSAPLLGMFRADVRAEAERLGVDMRGVWSCYQPAPDGAPCGSCDSCRQK